MILGGLITSMILSPPASAHARQTFDPHRNRANPAASTVPPLCYFSLTPHTINNLVKRCLYDHATNDHFSQASMQGLEVENQIQFANIFEEPVERFNKDLDQIEKGEWRFCGSRDEDEVEGCVVPVCYQRRSIIVGLAWGWCRCARGQKRWKTVRSGCQTLLVPGNFGFEKGQEAYGRKLQAEAGRWDTNVNISDMRRCCTLVSLTFN